MISPSADPRPEDQPPCHLAKMLGSYAKKYDNQPIICGNMILELITLPDLIRRIQLSWATCLPVLLPFLLPSLPPPSFILKRADIAIPTQLTSSSTADKCATISFVSRSSERASQRPFSSTTRLYHSQSHSFDIYRSYRFSSIDTDLLPPP